MTFFESFVRKWCSGKYPGRPLPKITRADDRDAFDITWPDRALQIPAVDVANAHLDRMAFMREVSYQIDQVLAMNPHGSPWFNPGYRYDGDKPTQPSPAFAPAPVRCECGSETAGCGPGAHSDRCPKAPRR